MPIMAMYAFSLRQFFFCVINFWRMHISTFSMLAVLGILTIVVCVVMMIMASVFV